jgi:hypothetical protein
MRNKSPIMKVHPAAAMSQRRILFWRTRHRLKRLLAEALASGPERDVLPWIVERRFDLLILLP